MTNEPDTRNDAVWQAEALTNTYLDGVRGAIPLAAEQIAILVRLARAARPRPEPILDLGCCGGHPGHALTDRHATHSAGVRADIQPPTPDAAPQPVDRHRAPVPLVSRAQETT